MKSYTDLSQSQKLAEFLSLESADMYYSYYLNPISGASYYEEYPIFHIPINKSKSLPCWSFTALLGVLPKEIVCDKGIVYLEFHVWENSLEYVNNANYTLYVTKSYNNPVDACYELILKLNELNIL